MSSAPDVLPHTDLAMRLIFEKVFRLEDEQHYSHQPFWTKACLSPFTKRILNYRQEKDVQLLRIAFYTGENKPLQEYVTRFSHEYSCCSKADDHVAFGTFKSGLY
ncbi:hypothetical protein L3X38_009360 [Prunus dulcis]|uniref:Retrotransposon gag domain-containing protein n=1 Tax=Prunus dulcis TaxID=3755 RepID=A0AAD5F804_PRUDU|nr:hypothetical protein L3X38_009360 [Prunus dulcis]